MPTPSEQVAKLVSIFSRIEELDGVISGEFHKSMDAYRAALFEKKSEAELPPPSFIERYPSHNYGHYWQTEVLLAGMELKRFSDFLPIEQKTPILKFLANPNEELVEQRLIPQLQQFVREIEADNSLNAEEKPKAEAIKQALHDIQPVIREFIQERKALNVCLGIGGGNSATLPPLG
jgi:hypothetical protein